MKKLFIFMGALFLGVGAFGIRGNKPARVSASLTDQQVTDMKAMMGKYIDAYGKYTKKSHIYLKTDTPDFAGYFHAGHTVQERTTYYMNGALLMGDLDGGFSTINSGYANSGENMVHFRSEDGLAGLTTPSNRSVDYTVEGKQMSDYFFNLDDLKNSIVAGDWGYNEGNYYHDISDLSLDGNGDYNDPLLKKFQYFAAPMLLQTAQHYLSFKSIVVSQTSGYLHICIYLSESDSGKVTSGSNLLAEAMVYAGLQMPGYYLVGSYGSDYDWQIASGRQFGAGDAENLAILTGASIPAGQYKVCQLKADGKTTWFGLNGSEDGNNMVIGVGGTFSFYLSKNEGTYGWIYRERTSTDNLPITFSINYGTDSGHAIYLIGNFCSWALNDTYKLSSGDYSNWTGTFTFTSGETITYKFVLVKLSDSSIERWENDPNRENTFDDSATLNCSWQG